MRILCAGCDSHIGEAKQAARKLYEIWNGSNIEDTGLLFGLKGIEPTLKTLKKYIQNEEKLCPGCYLGGGPSRICGIAKCVKSKGFWTCAECEEFTPDSDSPCPHINPAPIPIADKGSMMQLICRRYNQDNIKNLELCHKMGYNNFIDHAREKITDGWRTWQVISKEKVFTEAMKK